MAEANQKAHLDASGQSEAGEMPWLCHDDKTFMESSNNNGLSERGLE